MVAGGALNGTWRPQGGRAASPRPRGTQAALSRQPAGAKKLINSGFARERLNFVLCNCLSMRITNSSGFGISVVGVYRGDGKTPGTPKLTEIPSFNQILDNFIVGQRGSEKVHVLRTANTTVRDPSVPTRP